ncbi:chorismate-binding protein [Leeia sp. TBRC 13508]|uniref:Chorismate-binding protein n=1 Tax=Leeia speluncae TaxID=2884804 RepID=A0ABS8DA63_9NEIS|nr:chorismate-binding protein [Leeia speluncae]MCB6185095.1 chorismate-binding protein [Leeia speluncae]
MDLQVLSRKISTDLSSSEVFERVFSSSQNAFWLAASSQAQDQACRYSYMGSDNHGGYLVTELNEHQLAIEDDSGKRLLNTTIHAFIDEQIHLANICEHNLPFEFIGGFVGYVTYERGLSACKLNTSPSKYYYSKYVYTPRTIVYDHLENAIYVISLQEKERTTTPFDLWCEEVLSKLNQPPRDNYYCKKFSYSLEELESGLIIGRDEYFNKLLACKDFLEEEQILEVFLSNSLFLDAGGITEDSYFYIFKMLIEGGKERSSAFMQFNGLGILSISSDVFFECTDKQLKISPISQKLPPYDWCVTADHSRYCLAEENMPLVTPVMDFFYQLLPVCSVTGSSKYKVIKKLKQLELLPRGIYIGCLGYVSLNGNVNFSVASNTAFIQDGTCQIGVGSRVTAHTDLVFSYDEMLYNGKPLYDVLRANFENANKRHGIRRAEN